jgi:sugar lactone lactonase YvrE
MTRLSSGPALRALPVAAMLFLAAACAPSDRSGEANPDAPVVRNEGAGAWAPGQEWRLGETARIGADGEGNGVELGNIVGVALDPMGRVWVADAQAFAVHVFDSAGKHVRTLGRKGGGPGEYSQLAGMAWGPDGKLWVQDAGNARFTVYDTAGRVVATHPRESSVSMIPWPGGYDREGRLYDVASVRRPGGAASLPRAGGTEPGLVRMSGTMEPTDSFRLPEFKGRYFEITSSAAGSRSVSRIDVPFAPTQIWHLDAGGHVWTATTDRYRLVQHAFDGDTVRVVERAYQPVAVSSEDIDRVLEGYSAFTRQGGADRPFAHPPNQAGAGGLLRRPRRVPLGTPLSAPRRAASDRRVRSPGPLSRHAADRDADRGISPAGDAREPHGRGDVFAGRRAPGRRLPHRQGRRRLAELERFSNRCARRSSSRRRTPLSS